MIKPAQLYTIELKIKLWETVYEERYMFVNDGWSDDYSPSGSTWSEHEFVSLSKDNELLGYIRYQVNQRTQIASGFCAINFSTSIVFARDLFRVIDNIFVKFNMEKLKYGVIVGNPVEKTYDKLTKKYGGRIVGINYRDVKLMDGGYYDSKNYEIFKEEYLKNRYSL